MLFKQMMKSLLFYIIFQLPILLVIHQQRCCVFARNPDGNREKFLFLRVDYDNILDDDLHEDYDDHYEEEEEEQGEQGEQQELEMMLVKEYNPSLPQALTDDVYDLHNYNLDGIEDVRIKPSFLGYQSFDEDGSSSHSRYENTHRVILWYNPYCAHCQRFKTTFVQLAKDATKIIHDSINFVDDVESYIEFHAISCSAHHWLCEEYDIKGFPLVWVYKKNSNHYEVLEEFTTEGLVKMLDLKLSSEKNGSYHSKGNDLGETESTPTLQDEYNERDIPTDKNDEIKPDETVIDILGASNDIHKRTRNDIFHDAAMSFMHSIISIETIESTGKSMETKSSFKSLLFPSDRNEAVQERKEILSEYFDLLFWSLPPSWKLLTIISDIRFSLQEYLTASTPISEKELMMIMASNIDSHQSFVMENAQPIYTQSCSHKNKSKGSNYQCGLWNLFHIISIGVAERHKAVLGGRDRVTTEHAALTLKHFLHNFVLLEESVSELEKPNHYEFEYWKNLLTLFNRDCGLKAVGCNQFRRKRGKQSHYYYSDTQHWREFALWLWKAHNEMNVVTLKNELKEIGIECCSKVQELKVLYPSPQDCPGCHDEYGVWDNDKVYEYLKTQYWPSGIHNFRYVVLDVKDQKTEHKSNSPIWGSNLLSIVVICSFMRFVWIQLMVKQRQFDNVGLQKKRDD